MLTIRYSTRFKKDYKAVKSRVNPTLTTGMGKQEKRGVLD